MQIAGELEEAAELADLRKAEYERERRQLEASDKARLRAHRKVMVEWKLRRFESAQREALRAEADLYYAAIGAPRQRRSVRWARKIANSKRG